MTQQPSPPILALAIPPRSQASNYPEVFARKMAGRTKRALGDHFGLTAFGVNLTTLAPGARSSILHRHSRQQEFVYILSGRPTLRTEAGEQQLSPHMCVGFTPHGHAHQLINQTDQEVVYLEVGDRDPDDAVTYPEDDLAAIRNGTGWTFARKDGSPYSK